MTLTLTKLAVNVIQMPLIPTPKQSIIFFVY